MSTNRESADRAQIELLKHYLAALAYRTQKALRGAPSSFAGFRAGEGTRTPHELVSHMHGVLGYARYKLVGGKASTEELPDFEAEVRRFHDMLKSLAEGIDQSPELNQDTLFRLLQGPFADAMTHAGQLALLRRLAGEAVPAENFYKARVHADNLGVDQPTPVDSDH